MSSQAQRHDVVGITMRLKRWAEDRKGEDGMKVNQELNLAGRAENGRNLFKAILQPISFFSKISH